MLCQCCVVVGKTASAGEIVLKIKNDVLILKHIGLVFLESGFRLK